METNKISQVAGTLYYIQMHTECTFFYNFSLM